MKKALLVSYYFPPQGIGYSLRALKFAKYFPKYNWEPYVLTNTPKNYYFKDNNILQALENPHFHIFRTNKRRSKNLLNSIKLSPLPNEGSRKLFRNIPKMYKVPDKHKSWIRKAVKLGSEIIENEKIDIIFATAPPFSDFIVASELKAKYGMPMIIDYQDSWLHSASNFFPTPYHRFRNTKLEQEILRSADETITVNRRIKELIISEYNYIKHEEINVINHGFDPQDYEGIRREHLPPKNKMRFTCAGSFFDITSPAYFLEALSLVFKKRPELRGKIEACFLGIFSKENLKLVKKFNVSDVIFNPGYVSHNECIKYMLSSDVLWFTIGKGEGGEVISPVNLSEYIGARKPILACVPDGAAKQLLKGYDAFKIAEPDNAGQIADMIIEYYDFNEQRMMPSANETAVKKFDVEKLTYQLVRYFEFLIDISPEFGIRGREMVRQSINAGNGV